MKPFLHRRVPTARRPPQSGRMFFVTLLKLILPVGATVILRIVDEICGYWNPSVTEGDVLNLDPKLLAMGIQKLQVFANRFEVIFIFPMFQMFPKVSDLRAFERF